MAYQLTDINFRTISDPKEFVEECDARYEGEVKAAAEMIRIRLRRARCRRSSNCTPRIGAIIRSFSFRNFFSAPARSSARTSAARGSFSTVCPSTVWNRSSSGKAFSGSPSVSTVSTRSFFPRDRKYRSSARHQRLSRYFGEHTQISQSLFSSASWISSPRLEDSGSCSDDVILLGFQRDQGTDQRENPKDEVLAQQLCCWLYLENCISNANL